MCRMDKLFTKSSTIQTEIILRTIIVEKNKEHNSKTNIKQNLRFLFENSYCF